MPHPDGLISTSEAASLTGKCHTTISSWARAGVLPFAECKTVCGQRKYLFRPLDLVRVMVDKEATCAKMNHRCRVAGQPQETYEDLCRLVEERLRPENLPKWWWSACEKAQGMRLKDIIEGDE